MQEQINQIDRFFQTLKHLFGYNSTAGETAGVQSNFPLQHWLLFKWPENLADKQEAKLAEYLRYNPKLIRGYLQKRRVSALQALHSILLGPKTTHEYF